MPPDPFSAIQQNTSTNNMTKCDAENIMYQLHEYIVFWLIMHFSSTYHLLWCFDDITPVLYSFIWWM